MNKSLKKPKTASGNSIIFKSEKISSAFCHGPVKPELIRDECLFELFEETARNFPDNTAIIFEEEVITYKELNALSNRIAAMLRDKGVKKEDRVAIFMPKSILCYAAILGVMKSGACYIPLDIGYPEDRIKYILENSMAKYMLVLEGSASFDSIENCIAVSREALEGYASDNIPRKISGVDINSLAYIIYTSGSTGRPKGVMIEHKAACNLVRASQTIYKVTPDDRVYQGFTLAFDASVEELWLAFFNGAALVPQTEKMKKSGPDLFKELAKYGISIISCVPTLLSMINDDLETLRLLILGGEACPMSIVEKFQKPGRRILNTYGPTEATVIATWSQMKVGHKVTIGKPLPNYSVYVVNEKNKLAQIGEPGELLIGTISLARGYIGREDLNKEKFIENSFDKSPDAPKKLYRSGDLVVMDDEGNLEFHGRIDDQVKIRGFRVELSEIENVANSFPGVKSSVVKLNKINDSIEGLCLYAVAKDKKTGIDSEGLFARLKDRLPAYMIPQHFMLLDEIPMLPSGKADRSKLPLPTGSGFSSSRKIIEPASECEKKIADIIKQVFKIDNISSDDHFFNDLGGHSLYAAQTVSMLRKEIEFQELNISDLYENPTIQSLAAKFQHRKVKSFIKKKPVEFVETSWLSHKVCGFFQAISLIMITLAVCIPVTYIILGALTASLEPLEIVMLIAAFGLLYAPVTLVLAILSKWLIIGRYKEGSYPLWGSYYFRWWLARVFQRLSPAHLLNGTPLMPIYLRLMGMKAGHNCHISTDSFSCFDLITIGENTSIAQDTQILGYIVENGCIHFGKISIGDNCYIGTHSTLCINSTMEDGAMIKEQSMVPSGCTIPSGEFWAGSPAKKSNMDNDIADLSKMTDKPGTFKKLVFSCIHIAMILVLGILSALFFTQGFAFGYFFFKDPLFMVLISPITSAAIVLLMCVEIVIFKRLFMNCMKPGIYSVYSLYYVRKWAADCIMNMSLQLLHTLYATLYTIPFLKALGAKIGKKVEISTVTHISPELFEVGDESFFADASMVGTPKAYNGKIKFERTRIGSKTFIGNSALVPINTTIGDECLIGVLSMPPDSKKTENGTSWLGTPAMFLHKRDVNKDFEESTTFKPSKLLYLKRLIIELVRVILPTNIYVLISYGLVYLFDYFAINFTFLQSALLVGATAVVGEAALILLVALLKFSIIGTYKPCVNPLWSEFVWKTEFVTGIYEHLLGDHVLTPLTGTPLLPAVMRLFGCRIGKKVFLDSIFISEFDLVKIGQEAAINFNTTMQTHLFEDRVLKMDYLSIGNRASVGNGAIVLYDTFMEQGSKLGSSSLLMKGEVLGEYTHWHGNPSSLAV